MGFAGQARSNQGLAWSVFHEPLPSGPSVRRQCNPRRPGRAAALLLPLRPQHVQ
jgi:hypothetical protein